MKVTREDMQLYAVTDTQWLNGRDFYEEIEKVLAAGATFLQLKTEDRKKLYHLVKLKHLLNLVSL